MQTMKKILTAAVAAATLASGLAVATDSSAQPRGYYNRGHDRDRSGAAIAAGIAGLALGSALAGGSNGYYGGGYYGGPRYSYSYPGYAYAPPYYGYAYPGPYYARPRTCAVWHRDRWGRSYRTNAWC